MEGYLRTEGNEQQDNMDGEGLEEDRVALNNQAPRER